ncbi:MAG: LacI family DNA-binding transcriptional regulator [Pseudomonadota bacterium]
MKKNSAISKRVTIKDIAKAAGVDPSTVTRALGGSPRVKHSTRALIEGLAEELGYVPSAIARSLLTRQSNLIGVVIPDMTNPFFDALVRGIEHQASLYQQRVLVRSTDGDPDAERDAVRLFYELNVDGLIIPIARCPQSFYERLDKSTPVIHVNRDDAEHSVSCNTISASEALVDHLIALGHRRIAFVSGVSGFVQEPKRIAYDRALQRADIALKPDLLFAYDGSTDSVRKIADQLLNSPHNPTAVFSWNDVCAISLIHVLHERGISIPEQMSVAGHDNIDMAALVQPTLTTVNWPMTEIGIRSVNLLMNIQGRSTEQCVAIPAPQLLIRDSTGPCPQPKRTD